MILDVLPITLEMQDAILVVERGIAGYGAGSYTQRVDLPKIELANAVLAALELPIYPSPAEAPEISEALRANRRRSIPFIVRARVLARDGFKCVECPEAADLTIDHIVPVVAGGSDEESNLRTLCRRCNSRKGARFESL